MLEEVQTPGIDNFVSSFSHTGCMIDDTLTKAHCATDSIGEVGVAGSIRIQVNLAKDVLWAFFFCRHFRLRCTLSYLTLMLAGLLEAMDGPFRSDLFGLMRFSLLQRQWYRDIVHMSRPVFAEEVLEPFQCRILPAVSSSR